VQDANEAETRHSVQPENHSFENT